MKETVKHKSFNSVEIRFGAQGHWSLIQPVLDHTSTTVISVGTVLLCFVPGQRQDTLGSYGNRTFAAAGPRLWNSLLVQLRNPDITYELFGQQLKGHLFREAGTRHSLTSDLRRLRKTLTYLLTCMPVSLKSCLMVSIQVFLSFPVFYFVLFASRCMTCLSICKRDKLFLP